jgi:hypothetical protein
MSFSERHRNSGNGTEVELMGLQQQMVILQCLAGIDSQNHLLQNIFFFLD